MRTEPYRDRDLGAALLELAVPEHGKAFFAELQERLVAERDRRHTVRRTRWMSASLAVVGIVLLAALVFLTLGLPRLRSESDVARAAVIRTQVMKALAETRTVHGGSSTGHSTCAGARRSPRARHSPQMPPATSA